MSRSVKSNNGTHQVYKKLLPSKGFQIQTERMKFIFLNHEGLEVVTQDDWPHENTTNVTTQYKPYGVKVTEKYGAGDYPSLMTVTGPFDVVSTRSTGTSTQDERANEQEPTCKICYNNSVDVVFIPCGHILRAVFQKMRRVLCMICKIRIVNINKFHFQVETRRGNV